MNAGTRAVARTAVWSVLLFSNVWSVHAALGVLDITVPSGLSTVAMPFLDGSNTVAELLPFVPEGTQLYKLAHTFSDRTFDDGNGLATSVRWTVNQFQHGAWLNPAQTLRPGEGAFIRNPGDPFNVEFVGEVPVGLVRSALPAGVNVISPIYPPDLDFLPRDGDSLTRWDATGGNYGDAYLYFGGIGWIDGDFNIGDPLIAFGESVLYMRAPLFTEASLSPDAAIYFNNYIPAAGVNSPLGTTYGCIGTNFVAQLWFSTGVPAGFFLPLGAPVPVVGEGNTGFLDPHSELLLVRPLELNGHGALPAKVRVWDKRAGAFEQAQADFAVWGESSTFTVDFGSEVVPPHNLPDFPLSLMGPLTPFPIAQPPSHTTAIFGDNAQLAVSLQSYAGYTFQWQQETLDPGPSAVAWTNILNATSNVLAFPSVAFADAGNYRVVITYDCTNRISAPATLTVTRSVLSPPTLRAADGAFVFNVVSQPGLNYELVSSTDLDAWSGGPVFSNTPAHWSIEVTNRSSARRFYRLRVVP